MTEQDALAAADEVDGVVSDHIAQAQRVHADLAGAAGAGLAAAPMDEVGAGATGGGEDGIGDAEGGPGWRIDLLVVVRLDDLDVEIRPERLRQLRSGAEHHVHAYRHV